MKEGFPKWKLNPNLIKTSLKIRRISICKKTVKIWQHLESDLSSVTSLMGSNRRVGFTSPTAVASMLTIFSCGTATTLCPLMSMMRCPTLTPPRSAMPPRNRLQICTNKSHNCLFHHNVCHTLHIVIIACDRVDRAAEKNKFIEFLSTFKDLTVSFKEQNYQHEIQKKQNICFFFFFFSGVHH